MDKDPLTGLALKGSLSPSAAAPPYPHPFRQRRSQSTPPGRWGGLEPMQAVSPLAILRVAEPHA